MWGPPTCSQDVREARETELEEGVAVDVAKRRDRIGQLLHDQFCRNSWVGEDQAGRPVPCPRCHQGIEQRLARSRGAVS